MRHRMSVSRQDVIRLIKFGVVGVFNTAVDYGIYALLVRLCAVDAVAAQVVSYTCGVLNSYVWNRSWTFRARGRFFSLTMVRFIIANLITMAISMGFVYYLTDILHMDELLAKIPTTIVTIGFNFLLSSLWVFKNERREPVAGIGFDEEHHDQ